MEYNVDELLEFFEFDGDFGSGLVLLMLIIIEFYEVWMINNGFKDFGELGFNIELLIF